MSVSTICALEEGQRRRSHPHTLLALADALGLSNNERAGLLELASRSSAQTEAIRPTPTRSEDSRPNKPPVSMPILRMATQRPVRVRLPVPPTPLIGREADVAATTAQLDPARFAARLLTLTGPGGVGKTRLALAVAAALANAFAHAVVFVDLAPLRDQHLVPATIAHALQVPGSGGRSARELLLEHLRERQLLLVLDNFEHLLGAAPLLDELLESCPRLALLVTSRTVLRLRVEQRFRVAPLAAPADQSASTEVIASSPAVRLFVDRARAVEADFALDASNARQVGAICRQLEGMPLATASSEFDWSCLVHLRVAA